jgi:hypothetical protein
MKSDQESNGIYEEYIQSFEKTNADLISNLSGIVGKPPLSAATATSAASSSAQTQTISLASKVKIQHNSLNSIYGKLKLTTETTQEKIKEKRAKLEELKKLDLPKSIIELKTVVGKLNEQYNLLAVSTQKIETGKADIKKKSEEETIKRESTSRELGKLDNKMEGIKMSLFNILSALQGKSKTVKEAAAEADSNAKDFSKSLAENKETQQQTEVTVVKARTEKASKDVALKEAVEIFAAKTKELQAVEQALGAAKKNLEESNQRSISTKALKKVTSEQGYIKTQESSKQTDLKISLESKASALVSAKSRNAQLESLIAAQINTNELAETLYKKIITPSERFTKRYLEAGRLIEKLSYKFTKTTLAKASIPAAMPFANDIVKALEKMKEALIGIAFSDLSPKKGFVKGSCIESTFASLVLLEKWTNEGIQASSSATNDIFKIIDRMSLKATSSSPSMSIMHSGDKTSADNERVIHDLKTNSAKLAQTAHESEQTKDKTLISVSKKVEHARNQLADKKKEKEKQKKEEEEEADNKAIQEKSSESTVKSKKGKPTASKPIVAIAAKRSKPDELAEEIGEEGEDIFHDTSASQVVVKQGVSKDTFPAPRQGLNHNPLPRPLPQQSRQSQDVSSAPMTLSAGGMAKKRRVHYDDDKDKAEYYDKKEEEQDNDSDSVLDMVASHRGKTVLPGKRAGGGGSPDGGGDSRGRTEGRQQVQAMHPTAPPTQFQHSQQQHSQQQRPRASPSTSHITPVQRQVQVPLAKKSTPSTSAYKTPTPSSSIVMKQPPAKSTMFLNDVFDDMG